MMFNVLSREKIIAYFNITQRNKNCCLIITLIDGTSICGYYYARSSTLYETDTEQKDYYPKTSNASKPEHILLSDQNGSSIKTYSIPLDKIAGITAFRYKEEQYTSDRSELNDIEKNLDKENKYHSRISFRTCMLEELELKCKKYGFDYFTVNTRAKVGKCPVKRQIIFGELHTDTKVPLYADWEYISNRLGGLNSIGLGVAMVSASASWQQSLYSYRKKIMRGKKKSISSIRNEAFESVIVEAYIDFLYIQKKNKTIIPYENMDGDKWIPVILQEESINHDNELQDGKWCVGYLREQCMQVPKSALEAIRTPLRIQGELVPMTASTSLGDSDFFIKIRNISS